MPLPPEAVIAGIFDLARWPDFKGYGPLPGIASARFETQTPNWVGTRIRVTNSDGSTHLEEVLSCDANSLLMQLTDFSPPVAHLASHFEEDWQLTALNENQTQVVRRFALYAHNPLCRWVLRGIAVLLKQAVQRHLDQMATGS